MIKRSVIAVILAVILLVGGFFAYELLTNRTFRLMILGTPSRPTLAEISRKSGIVFPASSRLIGAADYTFQDITLHAAVEMHRKDVQQFLTSLPGRKTICKRNELRSIVGSLPKERQWWKPESVSKSKAIRVDLPRGSYENANELELLISLDHPTRSIVYIFWTAD